MKSVLLTIAILLLGSLLQKRNPILAGFIAVIPIKILGVALSSFETGGAAHLRTVIGSMLIWQFVWGIALLVLYFALKES